MKQLQRMDRIISLFLLFLWINGTALGWDLSVAIILDEHSGDLSRLLASIRSQEMPDPAPTSIDLLFVQPTPHVILSVAQLARLKSLSWGLGRTRIVSYPIKGQNSISPNIFSFWDSVHANDCYLLLLNTRSELSVLALKWVAAAIQYVESGHIVERSRIAGLSLSNPTVVEALIGTPPFNAVDIVARYGKPAGHPYLFQRPEVWGGLWFPEHWHRMASYCSFRQAGGVETDVYVPDSLSNKWYGSRSTYRYMYEWFYIHSAFMLYPTLELGGSLVRTDFATGETDATQPMAHLESPLSVRRAIEVLVPARWSRPDAFDYLGRRFLRDEEVIRAVAALAVQQANIPRIPPERYTRTFAPERICGSISPRTNDHEAAYNDEQVTVLASTMSRFDILAKQISHFSASVRIEKILVVLHDTRLVGHAAVPVAGGLVAGTPVHFRTTDGHDSLSNRFVPDPLITTNAVLVIDDDMRISLPDLHVLHEAWLRFPNNIIGFSPRFWAVGSKLRGGFMMNYLQYNLESGSMLREAPQSVDGIDQTGYGLMLTKVMLLHRKYLYDYTCQSTTKGRQELLRLVDKHRNCEDIVMNLVVSEALKGDPAPLFVYPLEQVLDYGRMRGGGLSDKSSHRFVRTKCLNLASMHYTQTLGAPLPTQFELIRTMWRQSSSRVAMRKESLLGRPRRVHIDCENVSQAADDYCTWPEPTSQFIGPEFMWV